MMIPPQMIQTLKENRSFLITTHCSPDPDAVGAAIVLSQLLKRQGKKTEIILHDPIPACVDFFAYKDEIIQSNSLAEREYDVLCVVDCGGLDRTGFFSKDECFPSKIVNIDHHISNEMFGSVNWVEPDASASTVLLFSLYEQMGVDLTLELGEIIYATLLTETGCFNYSNTNEECLHVAFSLVKLGVKPQKIADALFNTNSVSKLRLMGEVLKKIEMNKQGNIAWLEVRKADYDSTGTKAEDTDGLVNYALSIKGVEVGILLREVENGKLFKASLRSKGLINVASIAAQFGGGGHKQAAGCFLKGDLREAREKLVCCIAGAL